MGLALVTLVRYAFLTLSQPLPPSFLGILPEALMLPLHTWLGFGLGFGFGFGFGLGFGLGLAHLARGLIVRRPYAGGGLRRNAIAASPPCVE